MFQLFYVFWFKIPCLTKNPPNIKVDETIVEKLSLKEECKLLRELKLPQYLKIFQPTYSHLRLFFVVM